MRLNIGSSDRHLPGFDSVDVRDRPGSRRGHAGDLSFAADGSVEVLFVNAVFEHLYLAQHLAVLREWARVTGPTGVIVALGIPDFKAIASLYLEGSPGIVAPRFDLYHVYRYTHGVPEEVVYPGDWKSWDPARTLNRAPSGYLSQLHKSIIDSDYLFGLLAQAGLSAKLFRYAYPGEVHKLNLGLVTGTTIQAALAMVPTVEQFLRPETIEALEESTREERLVGMATELDSASAGSIWRRVGRRVLAGGRAQGVARGVSQALRKVASY